MGRECKNFAKSFVTKRDSLRMCSFVPAGSDIPLFPSDIFSSGSAEPAGHEPTGCGTNRIINLSRFAFCDMLSRVRHHALPFLAMPCHVTPMSQHVTKLPMSATPDLPMVSGSRKFIKFIPLLFPCPLGL